PVRPELHQPAFRHLRDIDRAAVRTAEADVARLFPEHVDLTHHLTLRRQHGHGALAVAGDVEVAVDVAAHAVEAVVVKLLEQALVRQGTVLADVEGPDVALDALVDVERLAVGADLDAIGRPHLLGGEGDLAAGVHAPDLTGALAPVGVAGVEGAVGGD